MAGQLAHTFSYIPVCLDFFPCLYPLKIQVRCPWHTHQLSVYDSELVGFVSLLVVNEIEEGLLVC